MVDKGGVDDAETFLLPAADELGTIDFDAVDVDEVFVEGAAADGVLRGELVVGTDVGEGFDEGFDVFARTDEVFYLFGVDMCEGGGCSSLAGDGDGVELGVGGFELEVETQGLPVGEDDTLFEGGESVAGDAEGNGVVLGDGEVVTAAVVGGGAVGRGGADDADGGVFDGGAFSREDSAVEGALRVETGQTAWQQGY